MSTSGDVLYGLGIVLGTSAANMVTTLRTEKKRRNALKAAADEAAIALRVAAEVAQRNIAETARLAASNASIGAKEGAAGALNGTANAVSDIRRMLSDHARITTERFDAQDIRLETMESTINARAKTFAQINKKLNTIERGKTPRRRT